MNKRRTVILGDEIDFLTGFPFESKKYSDDFNDIKLLRGDNIVQGTLRWDDVKRWPLAEKSSYQSFELQVDDVVLAMDRPWINAGLKFSAVSNDDLPCLLLQRTARMRGGKNLDTRYLKYIIGSPWFSKYIQKITTGSLVPHISSRQIKAFSCELPSLIEQNKIAAVLNAIDTKIELNNRINTELEAMAKTLYDYWFVQFDFPDANGKPYKTSGGKMVYNAALKREIPEGWEVSELRNLVDIVKGNISPSDILPTTPYVGLEHIGRKTIVLSDWTTSDTASSDKTVFKKHDILFGKIRPYFHKVAVALFDGITSTDTILLRPKKSEYFGLALETVFTEKFVNTATSSSTGSKMPRADWNVLQHYKIPVPELPLLQNYQELFDKVLAKIEISVIESRKLTLLRDYLLPMLMNGQVTVVNKDDI